LIKREIINAYKRIVDEGLVILTWGNVSCRENDNIFITPSGVSLNELSESKIVKVNMDGTYDKSQLKPSVDTDIHLEIYNNFKEVGCVIHTHSQYATSFAQAKQSIPCLGTTHADYFYGDIPVVDDLTEDEIHNNFEKNIGKKVVDFYAKNVVNYLEMKAVLLPNHGSLVWGKTINEAVENAIVLEEIAKMTYRSLNLINIKNNGQMDKNLLDKHFLRKHGDKKYYGQK
jgi:L-ribulose-5-phosphate 4-epimerase